VEYLVQTGRRFELVLKIWAETGGGKPANAVAELDRMLADGVGQRRRDGWPRDLVRVLAPKVIRGVRHQTKKPPTTRMVEGESVPGTTRGVPGERS